MFKLLKNKNGLTLIEVIVSIAIIGIVTIGMISMFSTSSIFITRAGDTTEALFEVHKQIETVLTHNSQAVSPTNIELQFSSDGSTFISQGNIITVKHSIYNTEVEIMFFQPKY